MLELSLRETRRLAVGAQLLAGPPSRRPTKQSMLDVIRHIGALQIDSISVVARSHHLVLWSRLGNHPQHWLDELLAEDRAIFEYWAHAAAFVPIELFPCFRRAMLEYMGSDGNGWSERTRDWAREHGHILSEVVEHIRQHGPVSTKSFDPPEGAERAAPWAWYGNKPTNRALDMLWSMGTVMIDRRHKFQRWYDLTERVHPSWDDAHLPTVEEEQRVLGEIAVRAMGVVTVRWLPDYFRTNWGTRSIPGKGSLRILEDLVDRGLATRATVQGIAEPAYVWSELLDRRIPPSRTTLLSPFDNLVWDRKRTMGMFGFELFLEAYTPIEKRRYGYFSLPILYHDQLVGRLDPKADRKARHLQIKTIHLEPSFITRADDRFYSSMAGTLRDFAAFNGCDTIGVGSGDPEGAAVRLRDALDMVAVAP